MEDIIEKCVIRLKKLVKPEFLHENDVSLYVIAEAALEASGLVEEVERYKEASEFQSKWRKKLQAINKERNAENTALKAQVKELREGLADCMDFPMRVDEPTIPKEYKLQFARGEWDSLPQSIQNQIVFNASVGLTRVLKAKQLLTKTEGV